MAGTCQVPVGVSIATGFVKEVRSAPGARSLRSSKLQPLFVASRCKKSNVTRLGVVCAGEQFGVSRGSHSPSTSSHSVLAVPAQTSQAPLTNELVAPVAPGHLGSDTGIDNFYKNNEKDAAQQMKLWIEEIRGIFGSLNDGEISISPYDTAWVALIPALDGSEGPQFPKALQWIVDNQFADGSWGDADYFSFFDRTINTLGCSVALKTWGEDKATLNRGVKFLQENLRKIETEEDAHMPIGFEIVFPSMIKDAQRLGLDLPYDAPIISTIATEREKKLKRIPMDIMHKFPTTLLHSLEGVHDQVDWEALLKLQNEDGSFLNSPASTAACLLHTKDAKAVAYLERLLNRFGNAVPNVYPVDLFERMWIVDRLERLGIARYFEKEIKDVLDYVHKYFPKHGIAWARGAAVQDLDDTAMGFRLLRQHGYDVNENVFKQFRGKTGEFVCFAGQSGQAVTGIFNFYRATQTRFPGEELLQNAEHFARDFLVDKHAKNECYDKWIITRDLSGEVEYALETPWYCSLPRMENQSYINQYGTDDIWIGKSFYRMPYVTNRTFLELAKADFNLCQSIHKQDLQTILRWNEECNFGKLTFARQKSYEAVFTAVNLFSAPELVSARLVWAQNCVLTTVVDDYFDVGGTVADMRKFIAAVKEWDPSLMDSTAEDAKITFNGLYNSINGMSQQGFFAQGRHVGRHLQNIWIRWLESCMTEAEWTASGYWPSFQEYMENALPSIALEPIVLCSLFFLGEPVSDELVNDPKKLYLMELVNRVGRLVNDIQGYKRETSEGKASAIPILLRENPDWSEGDAVAKVKAMVQDAMETLVHEVHQPSHIPESIRQTHFNMARVMQLFYKKTDGFSSMTAMKAQMKKILFEPVS